MNTNTTSQHLATTGAKVAAVLAGTAGVVAAILVRIIWAGLSPTVLRDWCAVPVFGLPALSVWQAFGLVLLVRALV